MLNGVETKDFKDTSGVTTLLTTVTEGSHLVISLNKFAMFTKDSSHLYTSDEVIERLKQRTRRDIGFFLGRISARNYAELLDSVENRYAVVHCLRDKYFRNITREFHVRP